ncbi:universal stress protein [Amycolatopsis decaplanina]|uniref:Universal stress protein n=1 Tax=Amycolatopsis decaplanina DSM 44594 TaxID=1284240 RepID=M2X1Z2_9PSEU|nr:universal stress protein [Amycolatopsis decaplanina]EME55041.1 universal stress protein [Amycolatopsis decaplanina DSM 44594]
MTTSGNPPVVAAVNGSAHSMAAALWAAKEALLRNAELLLLMAYGFDGAPFGNRSFPPDAWLKAKEAVTEEVLREFRVECESAVPEVKMATAAVDTGPIAALTEISATARLLAIGAPAGETAGLFTRVSTSRLSSGTFCPVVVVRGARQSGPVVVGVDGSPLSEEVLAWAFEEASVRKTPLLVLHAWHDGDVAGLFTGESALPFPGESVREAENRVLGQRLAGWRKKYPQVPVDQVVVRDKPRQRLLEQSEKAQLVVVGSRGRGGFAGLSFGSTSHALVHHAKCPVMVVRATGRPAG